MSRQMPVETEEHVVTESSTELALDAPKKYQVVLYNDDYTPMGFVVEVLQRFFHVSEAVATQLMIDVHTKGRAICGVFTRDIAETIVGLVSEYARLNQHPLLCVMEVI